MQGEPGTGVWRRSPSTFNWRLIAVALAVATCALVALGVPVGVVQAATPAPLGSGCKADPSAEIEGLPAGASWHGSGCYVVPWGITLTKPITINGGTFVDPSDSVPPQTTHGAIPLAPIIKVLSTTDVTIENVQLIGDDSSGAYIPALVNNTGIDVLDSHRITLTNIVSSDTFGDGLELWTTNPTTGGPDIHVTVNGYTVIRAGRQGITPAWVDDATFNDVTVESSHFAAWDFESDIRGIGSGDVSITNSTWTGSFENIGVNVVEPLSGPVTFTDCTGDGHFIYDPFPPSLPATVNPISAPVTFTGGTLLVPKTDPGTPPGGIYVRGAPLAITDSTIGRLPEVLPVTGPAWYATGGAVLTLTHSPVTGPPGPVGVLGDRLSRATVNR